MARDYVAFTKGRNMHLKLCQAAGQSHYKAYLALYNQQVVLDFKRQVVPSCRRKCKVISRAWWMDYKAPI